MRNPKISATEASRAYHRVGKHITDTYDHPGTRQGVFLAFLRAINTYQDLKAVVTPAVLTSITEGF